MKRFRRLTCVTLLAAMLSGSTGCMYVTAAKVTYKVVKFAKKKIDEDKAEKALLAANTKTSDRPESTSSTLVAKSGRDQLMLDAR